MHKKSSHFINNKFTLNLKILALLLMIQKIRLVVKFDKKYAHGFLILTPNTNVWGMLVEYQAWDPEVKGLSPACVVYFSSSMARQT